jgi:hypothetical protein
MEVVSADLKINEMTVTGTKSGDKVTVTTSVKVHNHHDDNARHVQVVVILPPTSRVVSTTPGAVIGPSYPATGGSPWPTQGYVTFLHPDTMDVDTTFDVELVTEMRERYTRNPITAFVFGSLPDPNPENNCRSVPIQIG